MKRIFLCMLGAAAMTLSASAQNHSSLGIRAGMNVANLHVKSGDGTSFDAKVSFNAGVAYQQPVLRVLPLYLETGVYLSGRGANNISDMDSKGKINTLYLQIPLLVSWHFDIRNVSIQPYAGAYYAVGLSGKLKVDGEKIDVFKSTTVSGENFPQMFKRSDVGLRFGVGVAIHKHFYVGAGYDLGLTDILKNNDTIDKSKLKNGAFYVSVGFNFW